jgi:hypothetical protein
MAKNICVYTVLLGAHELLNEQPMAKESQVDFICFTDNKELVSNTWAIRIIEPIFPFDLARNSRIPKICPHRYLPEYDVSLYIDNTVVLKKKPEDIFKDLIGQNSSDFTCLKHSYRETVLDEFTEVAFLQYDDLNIIAEQLNSYFLSAPEVLEEKPLKGGFLLRNHKEPAVIAAMEEWLANVLRYSRRDQLSLNYVLRRNKVLVNRLDLDVFDNEYFDWPVIVGRDLEKYKSSRHLKSLALPAIPLVDQRLKALTRIIEEKELEIGSLETELNAIKGTISWKLIQPFRAIWAKIKGAFHQ